MGGDVILLSNRYWALALFSLFVSDDVVGSSSADCSKKCSKCDNGYCMECYYGYWGHNCRKDCANCWLAGCRKHSGHCVQCLPGWYGEYCHLPCSVNCRLSKFEDIAHCKRQTGKCLEGCKEGWWGSTCQYECSPGCQEACYQEDGACISDCGKGFYGAHCNKSCSEGCAQGTCDWLTGICHGGCKSGYSGDTCEDVCSKNCKSTCRDDDEGNGLRCTSECEDGWIMPSCDSICEINCRKCHPFNRSCIQCQRGLYGRECDRECSKNCINNECNVSGECTGNCEEGYHGSRRSKQCPSYCSSCSKSSGVCTSCKSGSEMFCNNATGPESPDETNDSSFMNAEGHTEAGYGLILGMAFSGHAVYIIQTWV